MSPSLRRRLFLFAQWLFAGAIIWFAVDALRGQWDDASSRISGLHPSWGLVAAATAIVLVTYALLIQAWHSIINSAARTLSYGDASRIWFVSNMGKYVPGKVWSIAAMAALARERNVSGSMAAGSALLMQLVTLAAGIGVVLVAGARAMDKPGFALILGLSILISLAALPFLVEPAARVASRLTGRTVDLPRLASRAIWGAAAKAVISWILYGIAFQFFVRALLGSATGATSSYIAVYAASYIIGFLALFAPGGVVVRESAMVTGMLRLGLAGQGDALAVALASRLWLTVTELMPGLIYLVAGKRASVTSNEQHEKRRGS